MNIYIGSLIKCHNPIIEKPHTEWGCKQCGIDHTYNYCHECGAPRDTFTEYHEESKLDFYRSDIVDNIMAGNLSLLHSSGEFDLFCNSKYIGGKIFKDESLFFHESDSPSDIKAFAHLHACHIPTLESFYGIGNASITWGIVNYSY